MELVKFAAITHQGPHLHTNEDNYGVELKKNLFMVCDGFGGAGVGDLAASLGIEMIKKSYGHMGGDPDATLPFFYSAQYLLEGNALINALYYANKELWTQNSQKKMNARGGVAILCGVIAGDTLCLVSVGNCSAYILEDSKMDLIIKGESFETLTGDSFNQVSASGLGLFEDLRFQYKEMKLKPGQQICFFSDGASAKLSLSEMAALLSQKEGDEYARIEEVFKFSNNQGNQDNQTGMILVF